MQGNCADPFPPEAALGLANVRADGTTPPPLLPQKPGQCLLLFTVAADARGHWVGLSLPGTDGVPPMWLDNLYVRTRHRAAPADAIIADRAAWMTNVTLQGNAQEGPAALWINSAHKGVFARGAARAPRTHAWRPARMPGGVRRHALRARGGRRGSVRVQTRRWRRGSRRGAAW